MERTDKGIIINAGDGNLRLQVIDDSIIRVSYTLDEFKNTSPMTIPRDNNTAFSTEQDGDIITLKTDKITAVINAEEFFSIAFYRPCGELIFTTASPGVMLEPKEIDVPKYTGAKNENDPMVHVKTDKVPGYDCKIRLKLDEDEIIHGFGSGETGIFNRKDAPQHLYQINTHAPVPFFTSDKNYGILFDTCAYSTFRKYKNIYTFCTDCSDMADFYFIAGDNTDEVIKGYRYITGQAPMMPKWLFGYAQSKEHYHTQQELLDVLHEYRQREIPIDLIVQDWHYWHDDTWSDKSFDEERYPDPTEMCDDVHKNNAHIMISVWPNTLGGQSHHELWENDGLLGDGQVYDVFNEKACEIYYNQLKNILKHGFDAWWCDCSEPYEYGWNRFLDREDFINAAMAPFRQYMDNRLVNAYSLLHCKNVYENQRKELPQKRVVNLTRSGYGGQQRYSGIVWSGDITGTWDTFKDQIGEGLNFCASGLPYWTLDAGGFFILKNKDPWNMECEYKKPYDKGYCELYTRWLQYSCFLPMFRSHGTDFGREAWQFGEEFYGAITDAISLRYRFIPYIYSMAWMVTDKDYTMLRHLGFDFGHDEWAKGISDQFMFGPSIMVCPVTKPMYYTEGDKKTDEEKTVDVYLPEGKWYDYYTNEALNGGQYINADAPLDKIPLFIPSGAILPETEPMQYVDEIPDAPYIIKIYEGKNGKFTIYEDKGDGYGYENGEYAEFDVVWNDEKREVTLSDRRGGFDGMISERILKLNIISEKAVITDEVLYKGKEIKAKF